MADQPPTTPVRAVEAARNGAPPVLHPGSRPGPAPVVPAFRALLAALAAYVGAERDAIDLGEAIWDPAHRPCLAAAEEAQTALTGALRRLGTITLRRAEEAPLFALARGIEDLLGAETPEEARAAQAAITRFEARFGLRRDGPARPLDQLLRIGILRLRELAALAIHAGPGPEADGVPPDLSEAGWSLCPA